MNIEKLKSKIINKMKAPDDYRNMNDKINKELLSRNINRLLDAGDATLLDCGCGNGEKLLGIKESFPEFKNYIGIDNFLPAIESCSKLSNKRIQIIHADCLSMPIKDKTIDIIISNQVIEHIRQFKGYLSEIKRVLKPDGLLILSTPNAHCPRNTFLKLIGRQPIMRWGNPDKIPSERFRGHTQEFTEIELITLLNSFHFMVIDIQPILPKIIFNGNVLFNFYTIVEYIFYILTKPFVAKGYTKNSNLVCCLSKS